MSPFRSPSKRIRTVIVALCCGGLIGAMPVAAASAAKSKTTNTSDFGGTARKN